MDKILRKRIFREFKANIFRYVALALMMIMGMYLVVAIVGAADMIADGTDKNTAKRVKLEEIDYRKRRILSTGAVEC